MVHFFPDIHRACTPAKPGLQRNSLLRQLDGPQILVFRVTNEDPVGITRRFGDHGFVLPEYELDHGQMRVHLEQHACVLAEHDGIDLAESELVNRVNRNPHRASIGTTGVSDDQLMIPFGFSNITLLP